MLTIKLIPEFEEKLKPFRIIIDSHLIMQNLIGEKIKLNEFDNSEIYDGWDCDSPDCLTLRITSQNSQFDLSINPQDGELILYIKDSLINPEVRTYLDYVYHNNTINNKGENRISVHTTRNTITGYFSNHDDIVMEIIKKYFGYNNPKKEDEK